jgi:predicted transcriptional regulator
MRQRRQDVSDTEMAVLQVLWERGTASRRQVTDALYPGGGPAQYATVQKLLERLEAKGYVSHVRDAQGVLDFTARVGREEFISLRLRDMADKLCGGSVTPLLMNLVRAKPLTPAELQELRDLVTELGRQGRRKGDKS